MVAARRKTVALYRTAAAAAILVCGFLAFWAVRGPWSGPRDGFATFAAGSHLRYSRGALSLDIHSDEPHVVA